MLEYIGECEFQLVGTITDKVKKDNRNWLHKVLGLKQTTYTLVVNLDLTDINRIKEEFNENDLTELIFINVDEQEYNNYSIKEQLGLTFRYRTPGRRIFIPSYTVLQTQPFELISYNGSS